MNIKKQLYRLIYYS